MWFLFIFSGEKILGSSVVAPPLHHQSVDDPDFVDQRRTPEVYPPVIEGPALHRNNKRNNNNVPVEVDLEDADEDEEEEDEDDSSFTLAEEEQRGWINDLQNRGCRVVQVTYPRTANNEKELSCVRGEFLEVIDDSRNWWKTRNSRGEIGHVPHTIVADYDMPSPKSAEWVQRERRGRKGEFRYF